MTIHCKKCGSTQIQKCSAIFSAGSFTHKTEDSRTVSSISFLADRCRPPQKPFGVIGSFFFVLIKAVLWYFGLFFAILFFCLFTGTKLSIGTNLSIKENDFYQVLFVGCGIVSVFCASVYVTLRFFHIRHKCRAYPQLRKEWESRWYCHTCDSFFNEDDSQSQFRGPVKEHADHSGRGLLTISCAYCSQKLRIPNIGKELIITCKSCSQKFTYIPSKK